MTQLPPIRPALLLLLSVAVAALPASADDLQDDLQQVLQRFDAVQGSMRTLSADFTETTINPLLRDPVVAEGRIYLTKPDAIRWEYSSPEPTLFVISDDEYTGYFPSQKRAERRNIQRFSDQLFRFLGLGQASDELSKSYDIRLEDDGDASTYLLVLEPRKRRARKRVEEVRFLLDAERLLPSRVEYRAKDGSGRTMDFRNVQINPDLAASLYQVDIPADVEVTKGFSGLPDFDGGDGQP